MHFRYFQSCLILCLVADETTEHRETDGRGGIGEIENSHIDGELLW